MRLLFDQNLSPRLVILLADLHAGSTHVRNEGFTSAVAVLLRQRHADLLAFEQDETASFLALR